MDIRQTAGFFAQDQFDVFDLSSQNWILNDFQGKIRFAPESFTVNDLASRKRMLYTPIAKQPTSTIVRLNKTEQVYLVEGNQTDFYRDTPYMCVYNIHQARGAATIERRAPAGPSNNPGWAVTSVVEETYADIGFDRVAVDQDRIVNQYGLYTLFFASDSTVAPHDVITLEGNKYFLFDVYYELGLRVARATNKPDPRRDLVYVSVGTSVYNPATLSTTQVKTSYNVTAQVDPLGMAESSDPNLLRDAIKVLIDALWIGVAPKVNDEIQVFGKTYRVDIVSRNPILDQWELVCCV